MTVGKLFSRAARFGLLVTLLLATSQLSFPAEEIRLHLDRFRPVPPRLKYSQFRTGPLEAAKVFGRAPGCQDVDAEFIYDVNSAAIRTGLDTRIVAATIAIESRCDQFAVSNRGALGLMQPVPRIWKANYDFGDVNLLNRRDNLRVGTEILAQLVSRYGEREGLHHYNGLGTNCPTCDASYTSKILILAGGR